MGICCLESFVLRMMEILCERVVVWGGYVIFFFEKFLDLGERVLFSLVV